MSDYVSATESVVRQVVEWLAPSDTRTKGRKYEFRGNIAKIQKHRRGEVILSGPADTGKTLGALSLLNRLCWEYPGIQITMARKQQSDLYPSAVQTLIRKILLPTDGVETYGGDKRPERFIYPNGSTIWVAGMDKDSKVLSSERDVIYVNQAEELWLGDWEFLSTRATLRAGNAPFAFLMGDCNPAHPTHWILSRSRSGSLKLLETVHRDNPEIYDTHGRLTKHGRLRLEPLKKLTGARRQRLYRGAWVAPEGAIYEAFDEKRHKVASVPLPKLWPRWVGIDPFGAYIAAVWVAYDPKSDVYHVYREYYEPFGLTTENHAANVLTLTATDNIFAWVGGARSERQQRKDFDAHGIPLIEPTITDVWAGIDRIIGLISSYRLVVHDSCPNLISEIGSYRRVVKNGVFTDAIEHKERFHLLDALRYLFAYVLGDEPSMRDVRGLGQDDDYVNPWR